MLIRETRRHCRSIEKAAKTSRESAKYPDPGFMKGPQNIRWKQNRLLKTITSGNVIALTMNVMSAGR